MPWLQRCSVPRGASVRCSRPTPLGRPARRSRHIIRHFHRRPAPGRHPPRRRLDTDIAVSGGILEDKSSHQRQLTLTKVEPMNGDKDMLLPTLEAVRIEHAEDDPPFGTEAFTFMIRCKFGQLDPYPEAVFLRWPLGHSSDRDAWPA